MVIAIMRTLGRNSPFGIFYALIQCPLHASDNYPAVSIRPDIRELSTMLYVVRPVRCERF